MATLTADMKTFIENNLAWITTVDKDGNLDLGPKMSMFVLDDNHLAYHERTAGQHYRNLQDGQPAGRRRRQPGREEGLPLPRHRDPAHRRRHL